MEYIQISEQKGSRIFGESKSPPVVTYATVLGVTVTPTPSFPALDSVITGYSPIPSEATTA